jgi:hypothetical protein
MTFGLFLIICADGRDAIVNPQTAQQNRAPPRIQITFFWLKQSVAQIKREQSHTFSFISVYIYAHFSSVIYFFH